MSFAFELETNLLQFVVSFDDSEKGKETGGSKATSKNKCCESYILDALGKEILAT